MLSTMKEKLSPRATPRWKGYHPVHGAVSDLWPGGDPDDDAETPFVCRALLRRITAISAITLTIILMLSAMYQRRDALLPKTSTAAAGAPEKDVDELGGALRHLRHAMATPPSPASVDGVSPAINPKLCVIARTYAAQLSYLPITLLSLVNAGFPNLQIFLVNTDVALETYKMQEAAELVNWLTGRPGLAEFMDWPVETEGDYGYALSDRALLHLYDNPQYGCEYVMLSNGDNLYAATLGERLQPAFEKNAELIGWDFISHYQWFDYQRMYDGKKGYVDTSGTMIHKPVSFQRGGIDLGAAMFKMDMLKRNKLTFQGTGGYNVESDGYFIVVAEARANVTFIQHATLLMHQ
ncbi:hypothetical protein MNV49_001704 [Pseudohyphozyma bogoriensis]|nr:hypothetical protein MNV49_001704 [Pseudohyphozyma bogoriensis]